MGSKFNLRKELGDLAGLLPPEGLSQNALAALWQRQYKTVLSPTTYNCRSIVDLIQEYGGPKLKALPRPGGKGADAWVIVGQKQPQVPSQAKSAKSVNAAVSMIRKRLHEEGSLVTLARVEQELKEHGYTNLRDSQALTDLQWLEREVNILITCFLAARPIATLHDLETFICQRLNEQSASVKGQQQGQAQPAAAAPAGRESHSSQGGSKGSPEGAAAAAARASPDSSSGAGQPGYSSGSQAAPRTAAAPASESGGGGKGQRPASGRQVPVLFKTFNDLQLGSLLRHEIVQGSFALPTHVVEVPEVSVVDVLLLLVEVLEEEKYSWRKKKGHKEEKHDSRPALEAKLAQKYGVEDYRELGVRLGPMGYYIKNLLDVARSSKNQVDTARDKAQQDARRKVQQLVKSTKQFLPLALEEVAAMKEQMLQHKKQEVLQQVEAEEQRLRYQTYLELNTRLIFQPTTYEQLLAALSGDPMPPSPPMHTSTSSAVHGDGTGRPKSADSIVAAPDAPADGAAATADEGPGREAALLMLPTLAEICGDDTAAETVSKLKKSLLKHSRARGLHQEQQAVSGGPAGAAAAESAHSQAETHEGKASSGRHVDIEQLLQLFLTRCQQVLQQCEEEQLAEEEEGSSSSSDDGDDVCEGLNSSGMGRSSDSSADACGPEGGHVSAGEDRRVAAIGAAAVQLVRELAGPGIGNKGLTELLASYWSRDALVQMLLHAMRLGLVGGSLQGALQHEEQQGMDDGALDKEQVESCKRSIGLLEVLEVLQQAGKGCSLDALAELEQHMLASFGVASFQELQLPGACTSLLSLLVQNEAFIATLTGWDAPSDVGCVPFDEVQGLVRQVLGNLCGDGSGKAVHKDHEALHGAVSEALQHHFGVSDVRQLGYGPVVKLVDGLVSSNHGDPVTGPVTGAATIEQHHGQDQGGAEATQGSLCPSGEAAVVATNSFTPKEGDMVYSWPALALPSCEARLSCHAPQLTLSHALAALAAVPFLADLHLYTCWDVLYQPTLGPLTGFVLEHKEQLGFQTLQVAGGLLLKLPAATGDLQQLREAMETSIKQDNPQALVAHLLAHVVSKGGVAASDDLQLVGGILASQLAAAMALQPGAGGSTAGRLGLQGSGNAVQLGAGGAWAVQLILHCLQLMPRPLAGTFADELLLQPLVEALGQGPKAAHEALLVAALSREQAEQGRWGATGGSSTRSKHGGSGMERHLGLPMAGPRQSLHALGFLLGVGVWADDCLALQSNTTTANSSNRLGLKGSPEVPGKGGEREIAAASNKGNSSSASAAMDALLLEGIPSSKQAAVTEPDHMPAATTGEGRSSHSVCAPGSEPAAAAAQVLALEAELPAEAVTSPLREVSQSVAGLCSAAAVTAAAAEADVEDQSLEGTAAGHGAALLLETAAQEAEAGATAEAAASATDPCQQVVEDIRSSYGVGRVWEGQAKAVVEGTLKRLGNALKRLAGELYSKDIHFVMELVQNADDTQYSSSEQLPMLELVVTPSAISLLNNEMGFSERDVRGVCDVGESKKEGVAGYTGQKGIGFKSVFRVTDFPRIYSNGFAFGFDRATHKDLGYVVPTWLGQAPLPQELQQALLSSQLLRTRPGQLGAAAMDDVIQPSGAAQVKLLGPGSQLTVQHHPLKAELVDNVGAKLREVQPTLLLFLRKLRALAITDVSVGMTTLVVREEEADGLVRLLDRQKQLAPGEDPVLNPEEESGLDGGNSGERNTMTRWLLVKEHFCPGETLRIDKMVQETIVALAFELDGQQPSEQNVFAYLPVRRYGLNFIVQGDFVVPSNRGEVDQDSRWNQLLRSKVPGLLAAALQRFKALPPPQDAQPLHWVDWWLQCIPLKSAVQNHEFFMHLPNEVAAVLRASPCILTAPKEGSSEDCGPWVLPGQALVCHHPRIRQLVTSPKLQELHTQHFVHPGATALHNNRELRQLLGVREYDPEQLVLLVKELAARGNLAALGMRWLQQLLLCLFSLLYETTGGGERPPGTGVAESGATKTPGSRSRSSGSSSGVPEWQRLKLLQDLRGVALLPVLGNPGQFLAAVGGAGSGQQSCRLHLPVNVPVAPAGAAAQKLPAAHHGEAHKASPARGRHAPSPGTPSSRPRPASNTTSGGSGTANIAAAALAACGITQEQLCLVPSAASIGKTLAASQATPSKTLPTSTSSSMSGGSGADGMDAMAGGAALGGQSVAGGPGGLGSALMFLDPAFLELEDPSEMPLMLQGLEDLRVLPVEPMDVVEGWVLPTMAAWDEALAHHQEAHATAAAAAADTLDPHPQPASPKPPGGPSTAAVENDAAGGAVVHGLQLLPQQQEELVRLLAFPLAAGLLRPGDLQQAAIRQQQQQRRPLAGKREAPVQPYPVNSPGRTPGKGGSGKASLQRQLFGAGATPKESHSQVPESTNGDSSSSSTRSSSLVERLGRVGVAVTSTGEPVRLSLLQQHQSQHQQGGTETISSGSSSSSSTTSLWAASLVGQEAGCISEIYLPAELGNPLNLPKLFPAYHWVMLSSSYSTCIKLKPGVAGTMATTGVNAEQWGALFTVLGVLPWLPVVRQQHVLEWKELMLGHKAWRAALERLDSGRRYVIGDWTCPGLETLLASIMAEPASARQRQLRALAEILAYNWQGWEAAGYFAAEYTVRLTNKGQKGRSQQLLSAGAVAFLPGGQLPSSLVLTLQEKPWLVSDKGEAHVPCKLFLPLKHIRDLFKDKVEYVGAQLDEVMASKLEIQSGTSPSTVLAVLRSWSEQAALPQAAAAAGLAATAAPGVGGAASSNEPSAAFSMPVGFKGSVAQMGKIYSYLADAIGFTVLPGTGYELLIPGDIARSSSGSSGAGQAAPGHEPYQGLERLLACREFSEHALVWLPDKQEVAAAAQEAAQEMRLGQANAPQRHQKHGGRNVILGPPSSSSGSSSLSMAVYDPQIMQHICSKQLQGRFYSPRELRFNDTAEVVEQLPVGLASSQQQQQQQGQMGAVELRILGPYYPMLMQFFSAVHSGPQIPQLQRYRPPRGAQPASWIPLIGMYPTVGDYCRFLDRVAAAAPGPVTQGSEQYKLVMRVMETWSHDIDTGALGSRGQELLYTELTGSSVVTGGPRKLFPTKAGTCEGLTASLMVDDMPEVSKLFTVAPEVHFLLLPDMEGGPPGSSSRGKDHPVMEHPLYPFLQSMGVPLLSELQQHLPPVATDPEPAKSLTSALAAAAPTLQRLTLHLLGPDAYALVAQDLRAYLAGLHCWVVSGLEKVVGLPIAAGGVMGTVRMNGVQRAEPCKVLLLLGDEGGSSAGQPRGVAVVIRNTRLQRKLERQAQQQQQHDGSGGHGEESEDEYGLGSDSGSEEGGSVEDKAGVGETEGQAVAGEGTGELVKPGHTSTSANGRAGDADSAGLQDSSQGTCQRSADFYVVQAELEKHQMVAQELSQLFYLVCSAKLLSSSSSSSGEDRGDKGHHSGEACLALQQEVAQLLDRLLLTQEMGGDLEVFLQRPEYQQLPSLPPEDSPWSVALPVKAAEPQEEEDNDSTEPGSTSPAALDALAALAAARARPQGLALGPSQQQLDAESPAVDDPAQAALSQMRAQTQQLMLNKRLEAAAAGQLRRNEELLVLNPLNVVGSIALPRGQLQGVVLGGGGGEEDGPLAAAMTTAAGVMATTATEAPTTATTTTTAAAGQLVAAAEPPPPAGAVVVTPELQRLAAEDPKRANALLDITGQWVAAPLPGTAGVGTGIGLAQVLGLGLDPAIAGQLQFGSFAAVMDSSASEEVAQHGSSRQSESHNRVGNEAARGNTNISSCGEEDVLQATAAGAEVGADSVANDPRCGPSSSSSCSSHLSPRVFSGPLHQQLLQYIHTSTSRRSDDCSTISRLSAMGGNNGEQLSYGGTAAPHAQWAQAQHPIQLQQPSSSQPFGPGRVWPAGLVQCPSYQEAVAAACAAGRMTAEAVLVPQRVVQALPGDLQLPPAPAAAVGTEAVADAVAVGRFGEAVAFAFLQQWVNGATANMERGGAALGTNVDATRPARRRVIWVNQIGEAQLPFDCVVLEATAGPGATAADIARQQQQGHLTLLQRAGVAVAEDERVVAWVEVKATRAARKELFEISAPELQFAEQQGDSYWVMRVSGLGREGFSLDSGSGPEARGGSSGPVAKLEHFVNPVKLWQEQAIKVCLVY